ncbi:MAG: hypothetical protein ACR2I0_02140, partial [Rhodoferax sp.]
LDGVEVVDAADSDPHSRRGIDQDYAVALISLPALLGLERSELPVARAYLRPASADAARWALRIGPAERPRVGIVWGGRTKPDQRRSVPYAELTALFNRQGVKWYSLQVGPQQQDIPRIGNAALESLGPDLTDFAETAAAMVNLERIITIDTAVAHLAGALGLPTWLMLPRVSDWRWAATDAQAASAWYPSVQIVRQGAAGGWAEVVEQVGANIDMLADGEPADLQWGNRVV